MSEGYFAGVSAHAAQMINNWRRWCHTGATVVPVDFTREVDRFDAREPVVVPWALAVEAIYRKDLATNAQRANVINHEVFGGQKHTHRKAGVTKRAVAKIMLSFGAEIDALDMESVQPVKIPQAKPMRTFDEYRTPVPGVKAARLKAFLEAKDKGAL